MSIGKSKLHVSVYYQGNLNFKKKLRKMLKLYSERIAGDPCNPIIDISIDNMGAQKQKQVLLKASYNKVITTVFNKTTTGLNNVYTVIALLVGLNIQRFYYNASDNGPENWLLISVIPLETDENSYEIQSSSGYYYCLANHH